ncbi:hypothetical protein GGR56DRAFT_625014 [Xylariaceae sp. FL0804]|nr:hypothetical protein GGR56DRAFT_625014 [Xylariaceae sp. FL0804]
MTRTEYPRLGQILESPRCPPLACLAVGCPYLQEKTNGRTGFSLTPSDCSGAPDGRKSPSPVRASLIDCLERKRPPRLGAPLMSSAPAAQPAVVPSCLFRKPQGFIDRMHICRRADSSERTLDCRDASQAYFNGAVKIAKTRGSDRRSLG